MVTISHLQEAFIRPGAEHSKTAYLENSLLDPEPTTDSDNFTQHFCIAAGVPSKPHKVVAWNGCSATSTYNIASFTVPGAQEVYMIGRNIRVG